MRKTRKGGQPVKGLSLRNKFSKNVHEKDCGASVIKFLSYANPDVSDYLASKTLNGIDGISMLRLLQLAYGRKGFRWDKIDTPDDLEALKPNEATIALWNR